MNNSKSGLVGILSFLVLSAASLGILGVASRSASASPSAPSPAPSGVVRDAAEPEVVDVVWTIDEITVTPGPAKRAAAPAAPAAGAPSFRHCEARDLEQGGTFRPEGSSGMSGVVIVCG